MNKADLFLKYDWGEIAKKLTAFVVVYLNKFTRKKYKDWNLPKGYKAEDVAFQAITDVLSGKRNWNPETDPDLLKYLQYSVCRSLIANLLSCADNKLVLQLVETNDLQKEPEESTGQYNVSRCSSADAQASRAALVEEAIDTKILLTGLRRELQGKETDSLILLLMLEGHPSRDIAAALGIEEAAVSNAKKRIKRGAEKKGMRQLVSKVMNKTSILIGLLF